MDLENLNKEQKNAVAHQTGPLLIIAGAGTGKTRVLAHRIARLIENGVRPEQILAVTFTNKTAGEMRERVRALLNHINISSAPFYIAESPFIGTFHSLGVYILRENGKHLGIKKNFSIKDREDSVRLTKEALKTLGLDPKQYIPSKIYSIISKQKGNLISSDEYRQEHSGYFSSAVSQTWEIYNSSLVKENSLDFDDLISKTVLLLKTKKEVLKQYQNKWQYIHIDEYQDTNRAQYVLSNLLSRAHKNICAVGDGDQNIYSWRGATIENILRFEKDYPGARSILLEENYRSTKIILNTANEVIKKNKLRAEKNLFTQKSDGEKISLFVADNEEAEAYFVAETASILLSQKIPAEHIAVLYRANFQSRILEETLLALEVPYQIIGTRFFERKEIKDIISFISASLNTESLSDIRRIINVPPRGIGKTTIAKIFSEKESELPLNMKQRVKDFFFLLGKIKAECEQKKPSDIISFIIKETGLEQYLKNEGEDGTDRLENIKELATFASRYDTFQKEERLQKFLSDISLATDQDALGNQKSGVRLMTVHAAKGLEFPNVFITGLEQGLFPNERKNEEETSIESSEETREEERRLFYVAITRAKEKLYLSFARQRTLFGSRRDSMPSEFLHDIPADYVEIENLSGEERAAVIE